MTIQRQKFSTQLEKRLVKDLKSLAEDEGRQVQSLVEEAIQELLKQRRGEIPKEDLVRAYEETLRQFSSVLGRIES